jgi:hypothetical protein
MFLGRTHKTPFAVLVVLAATAITSSTAQTPTAPAHLPGELSPDDVLNGVYPWPASPAPEVHEETAGFAKERLGKTLAPGVHPRILISPEELPDLRSRIRSSDTGRKMFARLQERLAESLKPGTYSAQLYDRLAAGDVAAATALLKEHKGLPGRELAHATMNSPTGFCVAALAGAPPPGIGATGLFLFTISVVCPPSFRRSVGISCLPRCRQPAHKEDLV